MPRSLLRFSVPADVAGLNFADLPHSTEMSEALERLQVKRLGDVGRISLLELRRVSQAANAVALELGGLIRRARRGEFRNLSGEAHPQTDPESFWRNWPRDAPGEKIEIPEAASGLPLALFGLPIRLRNTLHGLGIKHAGDLNGKEYSHFLRVPGIGVRTVQDLRKLVQQIREGRTGNPRPVAGKKLLAPQCFVVPETVRGVIPYDFPISVRLDGVLRRMGIARLGDLHGVEFYEMRLVLGCGPKTLKEALRFIDRAVALKSGT